ncbi:NAD(P)/FAD-dependent oxidoreductase [Phytohalomonas tamaricis]|uniref:NAD(P)/FAD-dependent oxidoreductase n=1 Tax=Phytohalomonas tamaricis TaxID=2081032 RepID=UPI000D0BCFC8|nr:FAD-dependent oxidoreductase [Phytohalomonas tamaricis]
MTELRQIQRAQHRQRLVVIGNGMAGHRLLEQLVARDDRSQEIHVFGDEPSPAYNRIMLSPLLAGEITPDAIALHDRDWYAANDITLHCDSPVMTIDRERREVVSAEGTRTPYDQLVLATGSRPTKFPLPGSELDGIHGFRTTHDVDTLTRAQEHGEHAVVIGGGLLGLEAAEGLRKRGMSITVVHLGHHLLNRQLDEYAARLLQQELETRGLHFELGTLATAFNDNGQGRVSSVTLKNGHTLKADTVVVAAGITPNAELGRDAGLACGRAIIVDDGMRTSDPSIYALGECCEFETTTYGLVEPIWRQAEVLAARLCGKDARYRDALTATKLKVSGINLYAFGVLDASDEPAVHDDVLTYFDPENGDYRRLILRDNRLIGAVLYGDTAAGPWYFQQSLDSRDLSHCRDALLFGAHDATQRLEEAA